MEIGCKQHTYHMIIAQHQQSISTFQQKVKDTQMDIKQNPCILSLLPQLSQCSKVFFSLLVSQPIWYKPFTLTLIVLSIPTWASGLRYWGGKTNFISQMHINIYVFISSFELHHTMTSWGSSDIKTDNAFKPVCPRIINIYFPTSEYNRHLIIIYNLYIKYFNYRLIKLSLLYILN